MKLTPRRLSVAVLTVLAVFALMGPASAQTTDTTPAVGGDGYVAGVTTVAPQVQGATAVQPSGALPYTGGDSLPFVQLGVALVAVGAIVTFAVRKRNAAERV